jgi:hypothetical protein
MSTDPNPKRKRQRTAIVCTECRRRKVACDKGKPCYNCTRYQSTCTYTTARPPTSTTTGMPIFEIVTKPSQRGKFEAWNSHTALSGGNPNSEKSFDDFDGMATRVPIDALSSTITSGSTRAAASEVSSVVQSTVPTPTTEDDGPSQPSRLEKSRLVGRSRCIHLVYMWPTNSYLRLAN